MLKCRIKKEALLYHLDVIGKALSNKSVRYAGVKLTFLNSAIELETTNENMRISSTINDLAVDKGETNNTEILVNGSLLIGIIKKLDADYVDLEVADKLIIKGGKSKFTLALFDINNFPKRVTWEQTDSIKLVGLDFKNLIKRVIIATSTNESRMALTGVNIKVENNKLEAIASDSFRVAKDCLEISSDKKINIIIPATSLNELIKIMRDDSIEIWLNKENAMFRFGSSNLETRLINSDFPNVDKVFPTSYLLVKTVNRQNLISALERASVMLNTNSTEAVKIDFEPNLATISTVYNEIGQAREEIATANSQDNLALALSYKYLSEALKTFDCNIVSIGLNGETKPLVIYDEDKATEGLLQLILPVRI